ncbi:MULTISPECIES: hypothetical protein [Alteromonadaceae]|uniref:hypothetical protein n=1 Tax=Alteromonadaceae TaxID=72275 RepID=UPI001C096C25|nr:MULTISPECIES: hypothetical protein [Aliiglaciecola]MBU2876804.1 hypothetical protein [Aliiglaciecola lipolytica]MDO6711907.1 hypothetical protein [Aliiglaciecola sp. 2_MG-2023]MDO6753119.1 hypothetical protein [Aliiglaciecola sp. 1_MG-2023]
MAIVNTFGLAYFGNDYGSPSFDLLVDGNSYLETITDFEKPFAGRIAGTYQPGLGINHLDSADSAVPYVCTCGEPMCWFLTVDIFCQQDVGQEYVIWHRWVNPYRDDKNKADKGGYWNYSGLAPLIFEKHQYLREIERNRRMYC